ncbi:uncharacterized protein [Misgurnus anguillicaudatus]|uniref:uncharacterized protein n=1 Tax=Misgurnus anguillicaudatus TaxID=75329 RepID=UPI003CCFC9B0
MLVGDFMLGVNLLLSGNNFKKTPRPTKIKKIGITDPPTFSIQKAGFCVDNIREFWNQERDKVISQLKTKDSVVLLGDARMDSPGFCAQYCTYTTMENDSKRIVSIVNIDKRQTQLNSVIMEKAAFIQTLDSVATELNNVTEVCTDASSQISALFRKGKYKDCGIKHTLDIWHGAKNLSKRIVAAGQQKDCALLLSWNKDISNHFWYCCKEADSYEKFMDLWTGLLQHVTGVHQWFLGACSHGPLEADRNKAWIPKGSVAHQKLRQIVLDARWHQYLAFRSTSELESFHNHILMYASKRFSFSPPVYEARTLLAGLDYNHHLNRPKKTRADGTLQCTRLYNKRSKTWRMYVLKVNKDYSYIQDLQGVILRSRLLAPRGMAESHPYRPDDPCRLGLLLGGTAPSIQELMQQQVSRGLGQSSQ